MATININYIDTSYYTVKVMQDDMADSPATWGNYELVQFSDRDEINYGNIEDYCTENGKLLPSIQAKIRAGKMFSFDYYSYSSTDGGYYKHPSNETDIDKIDGFIIFNDSYIKNVSYDERQRYAKEYLEEYTLWANGETYGVVIEDSTGKEMANCWGFIGGKAVKQYIADELPDALNDNVTITGVYSDGTTYEVYFDYNDCVKERSK